MTFFWKCTLVPFSITKYSSLTRNVFVKHYALNYALVSILPILNQQKGENDSRIDLMTNLHKRMLPDTEGLNPWPPDHGSDEHLTEAPRSAAVTLKIRSRSPKSNLIYKLYIHENLVRFQALVHKILCRQESVPPTPTGSPPKPICPPPLRWGDITLPASPPVAALTPK